MIPYVVLLTMPAACIFAERRFRLVYGRERLFRKEKGNVSIVVFFIIFFVMLALRSITCGMDLKGYKGFFSSYSRMPFAQVFEKSPLMNLESGYCLLMRFVGGFSTDFQVFLAVVALICTIPLMRFYRKETEIPFLTIVLFCSIAPFYIFFSGLRQAIAIVFVVPALSFAREKKPIAFLITVLCATAFHVSAVSLLAIFPLYHFKIGKAWLLVIVPAFLAILALRQQIFTLVFQILPLKYQEKYGQTTATGAYGILAILIIFSIYAWVIPDPQKMDRDMIGLRNILMFATVIQCFALLHSIAMRYNYYFLMLVPIIIPKIARIPSKRYKKVARLSVVIMCAFFSVYFLLSLAVKERRINLNIYPYEFYWENR